MYNETMLRDAIQGWRSEHKNNPTRGLEDLMEIIKHAYERDIAQMENAEFLKHLRKATETQPDADKFKRVGEAMGHIIGRAHMETFRKPGTFAVPLSPPGQPSANGDVFPDGIDVPKGTKVRHEDKHIGEVVASNAKHVTVRVMHDARMYLINDDILKKIIDCATHVEAGVYRVYTEGFVCTKKQEQTVVREVGNKHMNWGKVVEQHVVKGAISWLAHAIQFSWDAGVFKKGFDPDNYVMTVFDGTLHLAYLENRKLIWVCRRIVLTDYQMRISSNFVHLLNPQFLCSGVVDMVGGKDTLCGATTEMFEASDD